MAHMAMRMKNTAALHAQHARNHAETEARHLLNAVCAVNCMNTLTRAYAVSLLYTMRKLGMDHTRSYRALSRVLAEWDRSVRNAADWGCDVSATYCDLNAAARRAA